MNSTFKDVYNLTNDNNCKSEHVYLEEFTNFLNYYYKLFVIFFGILGNLMCIFIFYRSKVAHSSRTSFYLISLAISDIAFLFTLLFQYLDETKIFLSLNKYGLACKTLTFLGFLINFLSCSFVLALTVQRFFSICFLLKYLNRRIENKRKRITFCIILFGCSLYFYTWIIYDVSIVSIENNNSSIEFICLPQEGFENSAEIFNFIDSIITLVIPFCLIVTMNLIMIRTLKNSNYNFVIRTSSTKSTNDILPTTTTINNNNNEKLIQSNITSDLINTSDSKTITNNNNLLFKQISEDPNLYESNVLRVRNSIIHYKSSNDQVKIKLSKEKNLKNNKSSALYRFSNRPYFSSIQSISHNNEDEKENIVQHEASADMKSIKKLKRFTKKEDEQDESRKISPFETKNKKRKSSSSPSGTNNNNNNLLIKIPRNKLKKFNSMFNKTDDATTSTTYNARTKMSFRISGSRTNSISTKISKMLIIVSTTFLILNMPIHSFNIYVFLTRRFFNNSSDPNYSCIENYLRNIFNNLFFSSFSCNFLLYSISGVSFRNEFKRILLKLIPINRTKIIQ